MSIELRRCLLRRRRQGSYALSGWKGASTPPVHWHPLDRCLGNNAIGISCEHEDRILTRRTSRKHEHRTRQSSPEATRHPFGYPVLYRRYRHRLDTEYTVRTREPDHPREIES